MTTTSCILLAAKNLGASALMESSAQHCFDEAMKRHDEGRTESAAHWALRSLSYSVGVFHPDYKRAAKLRDAA